MSREDQLSASIKASREYRANRQNSVVASGKMDCTDWQAANGAEFSHDGGRLQKKNTIAILHEKGRITDDHAFAASRLYSDYAMGVCGVADIDSGETVPGIRGAGGIDGYAVAQIDALTRYREAVKSIGRPLANILIPVVCKELTMKDLGEYIGVDQRSLSGIVKVALEALCIHYGMVSASCAGIVGMEDDIIDAASYSGNRVNVDTVISRGEEKYTLRK